MRDIATKIDGTTTLPADGFNSDQNELENAVTSTGQSLDPDAGPDTDLNMLGKAMAVYGSGGGDFYADSGAANAYVASRVASTKDVPAYFDGMSVVFRVGNTNTGVSTINVSSLGVKDIRTEKDAALAGGELVEDRIVELRYNNSNGRFEIQSIANANALDVLRLGRSIFSYTSTTQITITGGGYAHFGTAQQILKINTPIAHTITSPGTSQWQYIYADDSAIVTAGTNVLTPTQIINSTTAPTYDDEKNGWYNGDDLCLFPVYIDSGGDVTIFYHDGGESVMFDDEISVATTLVPSDDFTDVDMSDAVPSFSTSVLITFNPTYVDADSTLKWRVNGSSGNGHTASRVVSTVVRDTNAVPVVCDSSQIIEVRYEDETTNSVGIVVNGWFFPTGM